MTLRDILTDKPVPYIVECGKDTFLGSCAWNGMSLISFCGDKYSLDIEVEGYRWDGDERLYWRRKRDGLKLRDILTNELVPLIYQYMYGSENQNLLNGSFMWDGEKVISNDGDSYDLDEEIDHYVWYDDGVLRYWLKKCEWNIGGAVCTTRDSGFIWNAK